MQDIHPALALVLAQRSPQGRNKIVLSSDFSANGVAQIEEAKRFVVNSFIAVMSPDGRLAVNGNGQIFNPLRRATRGRIDDAVRGSEALAEGEALFRRMDRCTMAHRLPSMGSISTAAGALLVVVMAIGVM